MPTAPRGMQRKLGIDHKSTASAYSAPCCQFSLLMRVRMSFDIWNGSRGNRRAGLWAERAWLILYRAQICPSGFCLILFCSFVLSFFIYIEFFSAFSAASSARLLLRGVALLITENRLRIWLISFRCVPKNTYTQCWLVENWFSDRRLKIAAFSTFGELFYEYLFSWHANRQDDERAIP